MEIPSSHAEEFNSGKRLLPLEKARNFRDLGGYRTSDGRQVRWGRLFRSGVMTYLTERDKAHIAQLGIAAVCDLRHQNERALEPTPLSGKALRWLTSDYDAQAVSLSKFCRRGDFSAVSAKTGMTELYRMIPYRFAEPYTRMFGALAAGDVPLIVNCSAGKDRTGVACALILTALGVSPQDVIADYVLTDQVVDLDKALFERTTGSVALGEDHAFLRAVSKEARAPVIRADPDYLSAAFEEIARSDGSFDEYLRSRLGVTADMLEQTKRHLLV